MTSQTATRPALVRPRLQNSTSSLRSAHHVAYRCRDAEQTRWFYEDLLGLPLAAAMVFDTEPGSGEKLDYMHLFFQMGDGNFIAFFDDPANATPENFERKESFDMHLAFECEDEEELKQWQDYINSRGKSCLGPVDHHFVKSVYMYDPNGIQVEITCRAKDYDAIMAEEARTIDDQMKSWTAKTRALKVEKFGAAALDQRGKTRG